MIIVIPFGVAKEKPLLRLLTQAIIQLGRVNQPVLLVSAPSLVDDANKAASELRKVCASVEVVATDNEFAHGWFRGPNRMFHWIVDYLEMKDSHDPFLWLEIDACPLVKGWADKLQAAYEEAGMPHFGFVRPTNHKNPDGSIYTKPGDNMLLGVSIYPPHMPRNPSLAPLLRNLSLESERAHAPYPWDIYCRWQFFKKGVHATSLIYDRWCTINYRRNEKGLLVCDPHPDFPTAKGGEIPAEAILVHGCKDETLHRLVIEENCVKPVVQAPAPPPFVHVLPKPVKPAPPPVAPAPLPAAPIPFTPVAPLIPPEPVKAIEPEPVKPVAPVIVQPPEPKPVVQPAPEGQPAVRLSPYGNRIGRPPKGKKRGRPPKPKKRGRPLGAKSKPTILDLSNITIPVERVKETIRVLKKNKVILHVRTIAAGARIGPIEDVRQKVLELGYEINDKGIAKFPQI